MNSLDVQKEGYLRRLKTQKRRYFVLRTISVVGKPRLEYYESEKKFRSNCPPRRIIPLASCFNIARKEDKKHEFVFALYTREDVFGLICDSKDDLQTWLDALLNEQGTTVQLQGNDYLADKVPGDIQLPTLRRDYISSGSHVSSWPVTIKPRGLGTSKHLAGNYNLKLADHTLSLHKMSCDEVVADFHLTTIRRCGHTDCFFFMEVGRSSTTGSGELWMQVDDRILAKNLHEVVLMAMQSSQDGHSSMSRLRCHSGGNKPRPSSLMFTTSPRNRSDTLPDQEAASPNQEGPPSPTKVFTVDQNSPSGTKRNAVFQRLWSVGKRKSEVFDISPKLFSRRTQSKSLSIDPCPGGLLGRAQSMDFSNLIGALPSSPETPEEKDFDADGPLRSSSNSSGSSGRSWGRHSLPRNYPCTNEERDDDPLILSLRSVDVFPADEGYDSTARDDITPDEKVDSSREIDNNVNKRFEAFMNDIMEKQDTEQQHNNEDENLESKQAGILQRNRSGYEDMSGNLTTFDVSYQPGDDDDYVNVRPNTIEPDTTSRSSPGAQRRVSESPRSDSPLKEQFQLKSKSSPKQRRTSEPVATISNDFLEMVTIKNPPSSSPRRSKKSISGHNEPIVEFPSSPPKTTSPSNSPRNRRRRSDDEYVDMNPLAKYHTYVNLNPKEGLKHIEESTYMNLKPGDSHGSQAESEDRGYMNFKPGRFTVAAGEGTMDRPGDSHGSQIESEDRGYMNFKPGQFTEAAGEETSYVNFQPGSYGQKAKRQYENLHLNGTPIGGPQSEQASDYMNISPRRHSEKTHIKRSTLPKRTPILPNLFRRRESEPVGLSGKSDEENGLLFLDFSGGKSKPSKDLNYISLDLSEREALPKGSPKNRHPDIYTSSNSWSLDLGPKSAPVSTTSYAEIDFTRSHGLRQAIIDHKNQKTPKE